LRITSKNGVDFMDYAFFQAKAKGH
jgi:hypothetical protein